MRNDRRPDAKFGLAMLAVTLSACLSASPARANQWVMGKIERINDYTAYNAGLGLYIQLSGLAWGSGSTTNGPTACPAYFRVSLGEQGMTEEAKNRAWATLLTAHSSGRRISMYVDTSHTSECAVQIVGIGGDTPP